MTTPVDLDELERIVAVGNGYDGGAFAAVPTTKLRALITELRASRAEIVDLRERIAVADDEIRELEVT